MENKNKLAIKARALAARCNKKIRLAYMRSTDDASLKAGMELAKKSFDEAWAALVSCGGDPEAERTLNWLRSNFYPVGAGCDCSDDCYRAEGRCIRDWED